MSNCKKVRSDYNWARMPNHLLELILDKLKSLTDYLHFGAVCSQWQSAVKDNQNKRIKMSCKHDEVPMLLIPSEKQHTWNIYNAIENRFLESELVVPYGKRSCSSDGWLIAVHEDFTVTLYKPFSMADANATIHLPGLFPPKEENPEIYAIYVENCHDHISKATITADPLADPDNCLLVVLYGFYSRVAFIRPAKDTTWTEIVMKGGCYSDISYYKNEIYAVNDFGALVSCDISDPCNVKVKVVTGRNTSSDLFVKRYLVKSCGGELLQVERYVDWLEDADNKRVTNGFKVFKLDVERSRWVEMKDIGDGVALFLGDNPSIYVSASNFVGCQSNCIYFAHDYDQFGICSSGPCDLGVYDFKDRSFKLHYTIDSTNFTKMVARPPIWVVPTLN